MPAVCNACSQLEGYGGCCQVPLTYQELQLPITLSDVQKISDFTSKSFDEFVEIDSVSSYAMINFNSLSPLIKSQIIDGFRIKLKLKPNGECIFLKSGEGCTIKSVRPSVCKLFPFLPDDEGNLVPSLGKSCLANHLASQNNSDILTMLEQDEDELLSEVEELKKNIEVHHKKMHPLLKSFNIIN
jgi:Fe-S-cluster containining protein